MERLNKRLKNGQAKIGRELHFRGEPERFASGANAHAEKAAQKQALGTSMRCGVPGSEY